MFSAPRFPLIAYSGLLLVVLSGCRSNPPAPAPMPPTPSGDRIQSAIFPENPRPALAVEEAAPTPEIPEGVTLKLKGKTVDFPLLETISDPGERTVTVYASPTIPYAQVAEILDRLHGMGFLISFKAEE
ncbi:MAG: hypothetical protein ACO3N7_10110 [Kiritimatiellia bacterium]